MDNAIEPLTIFHLRSLLELVRKVRTSFIIKASIEGYLVAGSRYYNNNDVYGNQGVVDGRLVKLSGINSETAIKRNNYNKFTIYPNPANDLLFIQGIAPQTEGVLINTEGQIMYKTNAADSMVTLGISYLPDGVYFVNGQKFIKHSW
ncbi:MAG: T9SS type A sorting domain-containing protein [Lentimicrobiaceae bacterium]|nr:T9SS type A sorting domain-containing protein [Lentimicrobiaceae bacterium]